MDLTILAVEVKACGLWRERVAPRDVGLTAYEWGGKNRGKIDARRCVIWFYDGDAIEELGARCSGVLIFFLLGEDTPCSRRPHDE